MSMFVICNFYPALTYNTVLDQKSSKVYNIGSIIVYFDQHMTESQESLAFYVFFGTSTVFILPDKSYIDKIIKNV